MKAVIVYMLLALSVMGQTSDVQTVKAWTRTHVIGVPGGTVREPTGTIAEAMRYEAAATSVMISEFLVDYADAGLEEALARLYAVTNKVDGFSNRIYLAADMDDDPGYENIWSAVVSEYLVGASEMHYLCYYSKLLSAPPKTKWRIELEAQDSLWIDGVVSTNNILTNCIGYACYDIKVVIPEAVGNVILRANKYMGMGAPGIPLDIDDAGINLIIDEVEREPFTGPVSRTNDSVIITRNYLSGLLYNTVTNTIGGGE